MVYMASGQHLDSLRHRVLSLEVRANDVDLRIRQSRKQFQAGILVSTLGYTVTIAGGLMLGRDNDELGQVLLVAGGITGATGTYIMVDASNVLGGRIRRNQKYIVESERLRNEVCGICKVLFHAQRYDICIF